MIVPVKIMRAGGSAFYNPVDNNIYYDEVLDRPEYAALKQQLIAHELRHQAYGSNYLKHVMNEYHDYFRLTMTREFHEYLNDSEREHALSLKRDGIKTLAGMLFYSVATFPLRVVVGLVGQVADAYYSITSKKGEKVN